eukprot:748627-Prymnesium_polylepis.1
MARYGQVRLNPSWRREKRCSVSRSDSCRSSTAGSRPLHRSGSRRAHIHADHGRRRGDQQRLQRFDG